MESASPMSLRPSPSGLAGGNDVPSAKSCYGDERDLWRRYFADDDLESANVRILQEEGQRLANTLRVAFPKDARTEWTFEELQKAVASSKQTWESKERIGKGKPQRLFHSLMETFDMHSTLFEVVPSGNLYASLVAGGATILVKASVNHSKTIAELSNALDSIGDSIGRCSIDGKLIRSRMLQDAIAKLYIEVFKFFGEAAIWYNSSSTAKVLNSLHKDFAERFRNSITAIKDQAAIVRQCTQLGSQAELRVTRLDIEELANNLGRAHAGLTEDIRTIYEYIRVQRSNDMKQHGVTQDLLQTARLDRIHNAADQRPDLESRTERQQLLLPTTDDLATIASPVVLSSELIQHIQSNIDPAAQSLKEVNIPVRTLFTPQFLQPINQWVAQNSSPLLYLEHRSSADMGKIDLAAAQQVAEALKAAALPCVLHFQVDLGRQAATDTFRSLMVGIAKKFLGLLPEDVQLENPSWTCLITVQTLGEITDKQACELLDNSIGAAPSNAHLVIVGQGSALAALSEQQAGDLLSTLRKATKKYGLRVLLLTRRKYHFLLRGLEPNEARIVMASKNARTTPAPIVVPREKRT